MKKYTAMKYAGVELLTSDANVAAMTTMHLDRWTPDATTFTVKLVGWSGAAAGVEATAGFAVKRWRWVSLDIPLSAFAGVDLANLGQIVWISNPGTEQTGTFFVDNAYFYR